MWGIQTAKVGVFYNKVLLADRTNSAENGERIAETLKLLSKAGSPVDMVESSIIASPEELSMTHSPFYVQYLNDLSKAGGGWISLDEESMVFDNTFNLACMSVGVAISSIKAVLKGEYNCSFALTRPPGHHAGKTYGGGLCYFNNVAIASMIAKNLGVNRILVIDWDAHFGNGTYEVFREDDDVFFLTIQEFPTQELHTPSNTATFVDEGAISISVPACSNGKEHTKIFERLLIPICEKFKPEIVQVSAGQDGHFADPMSTLNLTANTYKKMTKIVKNLANEWCKGKYVLYLEGGYNPFSMARCNLAILSEMIDRNLFEEELETKLHETLSKEKESLQQFSRCFYRRETEKFDLESILDDFEKKLEDII